MLHSCSLTWVYVTKLSLAYLDINEKKNNDECKIQFCQGYRYINPWKSMGFHPSILFTFVFHSSKTWEAILMVFGASLIIYNSSREKKIKVHLSGYSGPNHVTIAACASLWRHCYIVEWIPLWWNDIFPANFFHFWNVNTRGPM